jgi:Kef-type K+ transport system membrane component KefB
LKSHIGALLDKLPDASPIWISNVVGSAATGFLVARYALDWSMETSLIIATAFSATSVAVSVSVWEEMGKLDTSSGQILVDVAELDDLSAAVFLAVLLGALPSLLNGDEAVWLHAGTAALWMLLKLAIFVVGCFLFARFLEAKFSRFSAKISTAESTLTISILGAGLVIAAIADQLGFSLAIGALFAGLAFSRDPEAVHSDGKFGYFYDLLTPFFFIHIGMQTDLTTLFQALDLGIILFIAAALAKLVSTALPALRIMQSKDAWTLGVSMIPRAEIALVVMYECRALNEDLVPPDVFAGMVLVSLATCVVAPIVLRRRLAES